MILTGDGWAQSYFDKEEIIAKMAEFHVKMMRKEEVVGRKLSTAIQAGCRDDDFQVEIKLLMGQLIVFQRSLLPLLTPSLTSMGRGLKSFFLQAPFRVSTLSLFSPKCHSVL